MLTQILRRHGSREFVVRTSANFSSIQLVKIYEGLVQHVLCCNKEMVE
jgi:hypothetical protein